MIERTTFDLRIAEHGAIAARIDTSDWRHQGQSPRRPLRAALAATLVALAGRLAPETRGAGTGGRDAAPATA